LSRERPEIFRLKRELLGVDGDDDDGGSGGDEKLLLELE